MIAFTCRNGNLCLCCCLLWLLSLVEMAICVCVIASYDCLHLQQWQPASNDHLWSFHLQQWKPMWKPLTTTFTCSNGNFSQKSLTTTFTCSNGFFLSQKSLMTTFTCCNGSLYKKGEEKNFLWTLSFTQQWKSTSKASCDHFHWLQWNSMSTFLTIIFD